MLAQVRRTIAERGLWRPGAHVIAACSGGPDSVAMVHALARLAEGGGLSLLVASVDHGLRPEAVAEVAGVGRFAESLGLGFRPLHVQVDREGRSIQQSARRARYAALLELARAEGAAAVAVGHTIEDQAETVILRMLRGAGAGGLAGIAPRRRDGVVRPLIDCTRAEVRAYVAEQGLTVVEDASNEDLRFGRVRVRREVLPVLEREDPAIARHLAKVADDARALRALVRREARRLLRRAAGRRDVLAAAPPALRREALAIWVHRASGRRAGRAHLEALDRVVATGRGEVLLNDGWTVAVGEGDALCAYVSRDRRTRSTP